MSTNYKLVYFNVKGLAETSRLLLALAQERYIDYRFPLVPVNHEFKHEEFDEAKKSGKLDCSMGKLPLLEVTTKKGKMIIPQSKAIERFLSRTFGFMGSNEIEGARIDAVCEYVRDLKDRYQKIKNESPDAVQEYFNSGLREELENLIKVLDIETKFSIGNKLSLADVTIYNLVTEYFDDKQALNVAGKLERIREIVMNVATRPEIALWRQKRPQTIF